MINGKYKIERIIFSAQVLRPSATNVLDWFYDLFGYYAKRVSGLPVYALVSSSSKKIIFEDYLPFDVNKFFEFYGYSYNELDAEERDKAWIAIFYNNEYNKNAYEYVYSVFKNSLVISHELCQVVINILNYFNIPYIDTNTDPVRFLDDQLLSFTSNDGSVYNELLNFKLDDELIYINANYIRAKYRRIEEKEVSDQNILLFLGQCDRDKSLIDASTGNIYSILDYKEDFLAAINGFDKVYYKRHPYVENDEFVLNFIKSIDGVEIIIVEDNFYKLISNRNVKKVVSISSGGCIEAKYFEKETQVLLRNSIELQKSNEVNKNKYISIYQDFLSLDFWSKVLMPILVTNELSKNITVGLQKNKFRNSRGSKCYWGYEDFEQEIIKEDASLQLEPKITEQHLLREDLNSRHSDLYESHSKLQLDYCSLCGNISRFHEDIYHKVAGLEYKLNLTFLFKKLKKTIKVLLMKFIA